MADGGIYIERRNDGTGRATLVLGIFLIGWMFFMMALAAFGAGNGTAEGTPVPVNRGVTVTPASGWSSAADVWDVGPNQVAFKRAGAVAVFAAEAYEGDARSLLEQQLAEMEGQFESFRSLPVASLTVAGGLQAYRVLFSGFSGSAQVDGQLVATASAGTGVVMLAMAPFGQLRQVQDDLDAMLQDMVVPR